MRRVRETIPATGSSMFPFVPAGSLLSLSDRGSRAVEVGDIVCYPAPSGELVAHRVVAVEVGPNGAWLTTRGDAVGRAERIEPAAVAWIVDRVDHAWLRYETRGAAGRVFARIAVRRGAAFRVVTRAARFVRTLRRGW